MNISINTCLLLAVVAIGLLFLPRIVRAQQGPDAQVLAQLRAAGSDLAKPHPIEFFLYVPTSEAAERLAAKLRELKFEVTTKQAEKGTEWAVLAKKSMVPKQADLERIRTQFVALAAAEKGEYDGWGSPVVN